MDEMKMITCKGISVNTTHIRDQKASPNYSYSDSILSERQKTLHQNETVRKENFKFDENELQLHYLNSSSLASFPDVEVVSDDGSSFPFNKSVISCLSPLIRDLILDIGPQCTTISTKHHTSPQMEKVDECSDCTNKYEYIIYTQIPSESLMMLSHLCFEGRILPIYNTFSSTSYFNGTKTEDFESAFNDLRCLGVNIDNLTFTPVSYVFDNDETIPIEEITSQSQKSVVEKDSSSAFSHVNDKTYNKNAQKIPKRKRETKQSHSKSSKIDQNLPMILENSVDVLDTSETEDIGMLKRESSLEEIDVTTKEKKSKWWDVPPCIGCGRQYSSNNLLKSHLEKMGPKHVNDGTCIECILQFSSNQNSNDSNDEISLKIENTASSDYWFLQCQFTTWEEHNEHINKVHDGERTIRCGHCLKAFSTDSELDYHLSQDHPELKKLCGICGNRYLHMSYHMREKHGNPENKKTCPHCGKVLNSACSLSDHIGKSHRSFPCETCGKMQKTPRAYRHHIIAMHTPDSLKPFRCSYCEKGFARKIKLKAHELIHLNSRPFKCELCDASFNQKCNRDSHQRTVHKKNKNE